MNQAHVAFNDLNQAWVNYTEGELVSIVAQGTEQTALASVWQCGEEAHTELTTPNHLFCIFIFLIPSFKFISITSYSISFHFKNISFIFLDRFSQRTQVSQNLAFSMPISYMLRLFSIFHFISMSLYSFYFTCE